MMLNKTFHLVLLSLIPIFGFSQANSQYPDSGNKIRLGFQTTSDGLIWRDTQPKVGGYQPINNKAAWIILDTMNNKFYHYKNSTWTLAGGQDIDTANLIATKYNLGFKLTTTDTGNMLTPYWRSGRFSGTLPVANGGTNTTALTANKVMVGNGTSGVITPNLLTWNNSSNYLGIGTSAPASILDVVGNIPEGGGGGGLRFVPTVANDGTTQYGITISGVGTGAGQFIAIGVRNNSAATKASAMWVEAEQPGLNIGYGYANVAPSNGAIINGNVGIGTASPTARLHVKGSGVSTGETFKLENSAGTNLLTVLDNGSMTLNTPLAVANGGTGTGTAFTQGSVVFAGASGNYTQSNANLFHSVNFTRIKPVLLINEATNIDGSLGLQLSSAGSGTATFFGINKNNNYGMLIGYDERSANGFGGIGSYFRNVTSDPFNFLVNNATNTMQLIASGDILMGYLEADDKGAYKLQINGQPYATNALYVPSDENYKENITILSKGLEIVNKLKPVTFNFISDTENNFSEYEEVGFIAQDVDRALSTETFSKSIVKSVDDSDPTAKMGLMTQNLIPILTKAIQEQNVLIKALEQRILILENK